MPRTIVSSLEVLALVALVSWASAPGAAAGGFTPGNLFVASEDTGLVLEFNPKGQLVRDLGAGGVLASPQGLAFSPAGLLFVAERDAQVIVVFDPDGVAVTDLDLAGGGTVPGALAFVADGALAILDTAQDRVLVMTTQGVVLDSVALPEGDYTRSDLIVGPAGQLFAADAEGGRVVEVDRRGVLVHAIGEGLLAAPAGLAFGPKGHLFVADGDGVHEFDASGAFVKSISGPGTGLANANDLGFGPNGNLFVSSLPGAGDKVVELDLGGANIRAFAAEGQLSRPFAFAFAPYRFLVKVNGSVARPGQKLSKLKEKSAVLSLVPGARMLMLAVTDDVASFDDLASVFQANAIVFHGFEAYEDAAATQRLYHGTQVPKGAFEDGVASIGLTVQGKVQQGRFVPRKASGGLHRASGNAVYHAKIAGGKLLD